MSILSKYASILNSNAPPISLVENIDEQEEDSAMEQQIAHPKKPAIRNDAEMYSSDDVMFEFHLKNDSALEQAESVVVDWKQRFDELSQRVPRKNALEDTIEVEDGDEDTDVANKQPFKRKRRHDDEVGEYDYDDPFIDDDDDYFVEQLLFRPTVDGYFVWKGAVPYEEVDPDELRAQMETTEDEESEAPVEDGQTANPQGSDSETRRSDLENTKGTQDQSNLASPVKAAKETPVKKKRSDQDGLVRKKKKKKLEVSVSKSSAFETPIDPNPPSSSQVAESQSQPGEKGKRQKKPLPPLPDAFVGSFNAIKAIAEKSEFKKPGKIPGALRDPLVNFANQIISQHGSSWKILREKESKIYWDHLKNLLPFQTGTIRKLVERQIVPEDVLKAEEEERQKAAETASPAFEIVVPLPHVPILPAAPSPRLIPPATPKAAPSVTAPGTPTDDKPKRQKKPLAPLPDSLTQSFEKLKREAETIDIKKGKFPMALKESLVGYANLIIAEMGGSWETLRDPKSKLYWDHLKTILPFQTNTIRKIVEKEIVPEDVLKAEEEERQKAKAVSQTQSSSQVQEPTE